MRRVVHIIFEPSHDKTNNLGFRPGLIQTGLYKHKRLLEAGNFRFRKEENCTIRVAKTMALISFAATAKLICAFAFAYADCWLSCAASHLLIRVPWICSKDLLNDA